MSDHVWVEEHVAAYLAGGLSPEETARLESHVRDCAACSTALDDARNFDRDMTSLFAGVRPGPELEDRAVGRLRLASPSLLRPVLSPRMLRAIAAVAAVLILGTFGAMVNSLPGEFRMPGEVVAKKQAAGSPRKKLTPPLRDGFSGGTEFYETPEKDLTNEDPGLQANLEAALPDLRRVDKQTVDAAVTQDNLGQPNSPDTDTTALALPGLNTGDATRTKNGPASGATYSSFNGRSGVTKNTLLSSSGGGHANYYGFTPQNNLWFVAPTDGTQPRADAPQGQEPAKKDPARIPPADPAPALVPTPKPPVTDPTPEPTRRVILRSGDIEFEVPTFDPAAATVTKLVTGIKGAFISTINSDKLPNGKVKGSITVRVPPEHLDGLVLDLRKELGKEGELKGVRLASQDVTKQYTDIESRLRGARTMETRLLQIIKEGKGEIKQLLEAERELGVWRTKIEEFEGELRYYSNLAALSTLVVSITEKEIRAAAGITERERVQAGVEVEDVDAAYQQLLKAITEAKGRILKSEVKQLSAGQFNAAMSFEVAPDSGGPMRDRLRQLGRVARLEIDRVQQAEGGTLPSDAKVKRGDTVFLVQLYNVAGIAPRETAALQLAVVDVPAAYQTLREAIAKTTGRVMNSQLNEQDRKNVTAELDFEVRRTDEAAIRTALDTAGEVISRSVSRAAEGDNVTDSKVRFTATIVAGSRLKPREVTTLAVEVSDVDGTASVFSAQVTEAKGRQVDSQVTRDRSGKVTAKLVYEAPLAAASGLVERFKSAGTVRVSQSVRDPQATEGKFATARIDVTLTSADQIVAADDGLRPQMKRGLMYSVSVLLTSVTWVVFGLCVVLPWAVIGYVVYRVARRVFASNPTPVPAPVAAPPATVG